MKYTIMPVIAILSPRGCSEAEITSELSGRMKFQSLTDDDIFRIASQKFNVSQAKFEKAVYVPSSLFFTSQLEKSRLVNCFKTALLEELIKNNIIYQGIGTFTLPDAGHILKVCLGADINYRTQNYQKAHSVTQEDALDKVKQYDSYILNWALSNNIKSPFEPSMYDMMIACDKHSIENVAEQIQDHASIDMLKVSAESILKIQDALLASQVLGELLNKKHDVDVMSDNSKVTIYIKSYKLRMDAYTEKLKELALKIDGVKEVDVTIGKDIQIPSPLIPTEFDRPEKVLLVDDEVEFVDALSERLLSRNFKTSVAYSGEEALESLNHDLPDVIILDLKMPGIDGIEVLRRVKREHPKTEVVILTGHGSEKEKQQAYELGAFAYLEKPVNINVLSDTMKNAYEKINSSNE